MTTAEWNREMKCYGWQNACSATARDGMGQVELNGSEQSC